MSEVLYPYMTARIVWVRLRTSKVVHLRHWLHDTAARLLLEEVKRLSVLQKYFLCLHKIWLTMWPWYALKNDNLRPLLCGIWSARLIPRKLAEMLLVIISSTNGNSGCLLLPCLSDQVFSSLNLQLDKFFDIFTGFCTHAV